MSLIDYCDNLRQREVVDLYEQGYSSRQIADKLNSNDSSHIRRSIRRAKARATQHGDRPEHNMTHPLPEPHKLKRHSVNYVDGAIKQEWVISEPDKERQLELMREALEALADDAPRQTPIEKPTENHQDLIAVIPLADLHVAMYAWARECGDDFNLAIAERDAQGAVDYLLGCSPKARRGVLMNLGDFFHSTNQEGTTKKSGNVLDIDGRFPKMIDVGVRIVRHIITKMLKIYEIVDVVTTPANHDEELAKVLAILLRNVYENEPRITIHDNAAQRCYIEDGTVLLGAVHGHQTKDADLLPIMATEMPEAWGRTKCRVFFRGHHHHDSEVEYRGGKVFQVRKLSPGDAYEVGHGYLSGNDLKLIVYNRTRETEQSRFTCGLDVVRRMV